MPIRLNLLAEEQAAEELRRRDPVKHALWLAAILIGGMLLWSGWLQIGSLRARAKLNAVQKDIATRTNEFQLVLDKQGKANEMDSKLAALQQLATNRFLNGTLLNALQQTTAENVQLFRLKMQHEYSFTEEVKQKTNPSGRATPARPATATERLALILEAKDSSSNPGVEGMLLFKEKIAGHPYFQDALGKNNEVRLTTLSAPQSQPGGRPFVQFALECRFPEKIR
jgi:site-specific recombinase